MELGCTRVPYAHILSSCACKENFYQGLGLGVKGDQKNNPAIQPGFQAGLNQGQSRTGVKSLTWLFDLGSTETRILVLLGGL